MRKIVFTIFIAIAGFTWYGCQPVNENVYNVTFQVDMSGVEVGEQDSLGIRGDVAPLSWTKTYLMTGPDERGIYKVTVPFENVKYGTRVQYKYYYGDKHWDNDEYAARGNRVAAICCKNQKLPVDKWNELDGYALEVLLESASWDIFMNWIYRIGWGKEKGMTLDEIAQDDVDFWNWPDTLPVSPEHFLRFDEFQQAKSPYGYFKIIENTPDRAEYIINKDWEIMINIWSDKGNVKGVTADEMTHFFNKLLEIYVKKAGLTCKCIDEPDNKLRIIVEK